MNNDNLRNIKLSHDEAVTNGRKGGIASGEARRRNRTLREIAQLLSDRIVPVTCIDGATEEMTYDAAVIYRQYQKAIDGDTTAAKFIAELMGELKTNNVPAVEGGGITVVVRNEDDKKMIEGIKDLDI